MKKEYFVLVFACAAQLTLSGCESDAEKAKQETERIKAYAENNCVSESMPFVQSQQFVEEVLKSPATADFPILDFKDTYHGDCTHTVISYVDSQNSFGATIRSYYKAKLKYHKDTDIWELIDLAIE